jgi:hypothetical protein
LATVAKRDQIDDNCDPPEPKSNDETESDVRFLVEQGYHVFVARIEQLLEDDCPWTLAAGNADELRAAADTLDIVCQNNPDKSKSCCTFTPDNIDTLPAWLAVNPDCSIVSIFDALAYRELAKWTTYFATNTDDLDTAHRKLAEIPDDLIARMNRVGRAALKPRTGAPVPESERAKLIEGFTLHDTVAPPAPIYLVDNMIPEDCEIVFFGGQSQAGKSFLAIYLAVCLASGAPFFGRKINKKVGVVILAAEASGRLKHRLYVAAEQAAPGEALPIGYLGNVPNLKDPKEVDALIPRINAMGDKMEKAFGLPLGVVIIDTLAAAFGFKEENSNSEAAESIRVMKEIGAATGTIVVPVHHYGKTPDAGLRGGSAFFAGTDVVLSVLADINHTEGTVSNRRLSLAKAREDETGPIAPFDLRYVEIGKRDDGESYGSSVIDPDLARAGEKPAKAPKESDSLKTFRMAFAEMVLAPIQAHADGPRIMAAKVSDVKVEFSRRWATAESDPEKRKDAARNAFKRGLKEALKTGFTTDCQDAVEWIWHPEMMVALGRPLAA